MQVTFDDQCTMEALVDSPRQETPAQQPLPGFCVVVVGTSCLANSTLISE